MDLKEATEKLENFSNINFLYGKLSFTQEQLKEYQEAIDVILHEPIVKDLINKNKVIEYMAKDIDLIDKGKLHINDYYDGKEDIIDYYYEKIKEE